MHANVSMLCRTVGQLGILASTAAALAPYTGMLRGLLGLVALASPTQLALVLLELLFLPAALLVCWASAHPWRQRPTLAGCGVLACVLICQLALLQSVTGLHTLWGAGYLLATVLFPLGSVGLLAASYHRHQPSSQHHTLALDSRRIFQLALTLAGLSTLSIWSGNLPSNLEISVAATCALYAIQRWAHPLSAPWIPVAAMLTALAALQDGLCLALVALGPVPRISTSAIITAGLSALTALALTVVWGVAYMARGAGWRHTRRPRRGVHNPRFRSYQQNSPGESRHDS
jgi:hypothetical protein